MSRGTPRPRRACSWIIIARSRRGASGTTSAGGEVDHHLDLLRQPWPEAWTVSRRRSPHSRVRSSGRSSGVDGVLVAGDRRRAEHDGVAPLQLDLRVVAIGYPASADSGSPWSRSSTTIFLWPIGRSRARRYQHPLRERDVAEAARRCRGSRIQRRPARPGGRWWRQRARTWPARWMLTAKHVTTMRPCSGRTRGPRRARLATRPPRPPGPRRGEVAVEQQQPLAAESASRDMSAGVLPTAVLVELESPVNRTVPSGRGEARRR